MVLLSFVALALFVGALVDIILRDDSLVKHLPKIVWVLLVVLVPLVGSILWFAFGRERGERSSRPSRWAGRAGRGWAGPGRAGRGGSGVTLPRIAPEPAGPDTPATYDGARSTEQQLADLEREIAFHERQQRLARLEAEVRARRAIEE